MVSGRALLAMKDTGAGGAAITIGGIPLWERLERLLGVRGWTLERGVPERTDPRRDVLLWDFGSYAHRPGAAGLPAIGWSLESPVIAHRAYHRMDQIVQECARVFAFAGAAGLVAPERRDRVEPWLWPVEPRPVRQGRPWRERRFACMVNSNKRAYEGLSALRRRGLRNGPRAVAAGLLARTYRLRGQWEAPELYPERLRLVEALSVDGGFDLFGPGWDQRDSRLERRFGPAIARSYRGVADDKDGLLTDYRFSVVVENTVFPGYVSEKLFDCLFAGTIPVYLGAPDVERHVPSEIFVDIRQHSGPGELREAMRHMDEAEARDRLEAAAAFLASPRFAALSAETAASRLVDAIAAAQAGRTAAT